MVVTMVVIMIVRMVGSMSAHMLWAGMPGAPRGAFRVPAGALAARAAWAPCHDVSPHRGDPSRVRVDGHCTRLSRVVSINTGVVHLIASHAILYG